MKNPIKKLRDILKKYVFFTRAYLFLDEDKYTKYRNSVIVYARDIQEAKMIYERRKIGDRVIVSVYSEFIFIKNVYENY